MREKEALRVTQTRKTKRIELSLTRMGGNVGGEKVHGGKSRETRCRLPSVLLQESHTGCV